MRNKTSRKKPKRKKSAKIARDKDAKEKMLCQKREREISLELVASSLTRDSILIPDRATVQKADKVGEQTDGDYEQDKQREVNGLVDKGSNEGEKKGEGEHNADCGENFGIDEALLRLCGTVYLGVEVGACLACNC